MGGGRSIFLNSFYMLHTEHEGIHVLGVVVVVIIIVVVVVVVGVVFVVDGQLFVEYCITKNGTPWPAY